MARALRTIGFILSVVCLGAIVYLSFAGNVNSPDFIAGKDKGGHFLAYMALSFLFFLSFCSFSHNAYFRRNLLPMAGAFLLASVCGYAIELCQPRFGRNFEVMDLAFDAAGAFAGVVLCSLCVLSLVSIESRRHRR